MKKTIDYWVDKLLEGKDIAAAKLITRLENNDEAHEILPKIHPHLGKAHVVGITGAPGVGKSTLTARLVQYLRKQNFKVGIIAVDPTSPFSGGAILGDRIRLQKLATDEGVFIRSMASRGHLGGVSAESLNAVKVLDAFGCDYIIVETVGVGQSEVEIIKHVDTTMLIMIPGMGDDIQAIKAGIMEIADIFIVNKADKDGVDRTIMELEMLRQLSDSKSYEAPVVKTIANRGKGIENVFSEIKNHKNYLLENNLFTENRKKRLKYEILSLLNDKLMKITHDHIDDKYNIDKIIHEIYEGNAEPYGMISKIIKEILNEEI